MLLEIALDLLARVILRALAVQTEQGTEIEFGSLEQLDFTDVDILERVDALGALLDLTTNDLRNKLAGELSKGDAGSLALDNLSHLLANGTDL